MVEYLDIAIGVFMVVLVILTITFLSLYIVEKTDTCNEDKLDETKLELAEAKVALINATTKCDSDIQSLNNSINNGKSFTMFDHVFRYRVNDNLPEGYGNYEYVSDTQPTIKINVVDSVFDDSRTFKQLQLSGLFSSKYVYVNRIIETSSAGGTLSFDNPTDVVRSLYSTHWKSALPLENTQAPSQEELFNQQNSEVEGALSFTKALEEVSFTWGNSDNDRVKLAQSRFGYILSLPAEYVTYAKLNDGITEVLLNPKNGDTDSYYKASINISEIPLKSSETIKEKDNLYIIFRLDSNIINNAERAYCTSTIADDSIRVSSVIAYVWDHSPTENAPVDILNITKRASNWLYPELLSSSAFGQNGYFGGYKNDPIPEQPFGVDQSLIPS